MDETHKKQIKYNFAPENKEVSRESDFGSEFLWISDGISQMRMSQKYCNIRYACDWLHQIHIYENFESSYINRYTLFSHYLCIRSLIKTFVIFEWLDENRGIMMTLFSYIIKRTCNAIWLLNAKILTFNVM